MQDSGSLWLGCHAGYHAAVLPCPPIHLSALAARLQLPSSDQVPQVGISPLHNFPDLAEFLLDVVIKFHRRAIFDCSTVNACIKEVEAFPSIAANSSFPSLKEAP